MIKHPQQMIRYMMADRLSAQSHFNAQTLYLVDKTEGQCYLWTLTTQRLLLWPCVTTGHSRSICLSLD